MSILKIKDANNNFVDVPSIQGRGISSIQKTSTSGLVDTYTITYSDGTTSTFNVTNGTDLGNLKYYEYNPGNGMVSMMFLYTGNYDYSTTVDEGYTFGRYLYNLIYNLSAVKTQSNIDTNINNGTMGTTLKGFFSKLLNALTEDSYCMCNYYSTSVCLSPTSNQAIVMFGDGTAIQYEVSNNVETITYLKSGAYHAGTNISIANDGTINNTYTLPSDVVQDNNYVHTDNNYTTEEKTKLASLENYNDTQITELIANLEEENEALYNDHPDITATGTNVTLNGTGDFKMKVDVSGNSTQIQYEGYNLLNIPNNEITLVKLTNRVVNISPINTLTLEAGTYTIVFPDLVLTNNVENLGVQLVGLENHGNTLSNKKRIITLTKQATLDSLYCFLVSSDNDNATAKFTKIMLYEGTTEKPYEPYVGNQATPNPTYKQDINNVEGDVEVKGKNRQLFDKDNPNILKGYFTPSDTSFVASGGHRSIYIPCKSNTTYTVQKIATSRFRVGFTDILPAGGVEIINSMPRIPNGENLTEVTTTSGANSKYLIAWISNRNTTNEPDMNNILNSLQIVEGSTAKPYTAYAENTVTFPLSQGQKLMLGDTLEDDGIHHKRAQTTFTGTNATLLNAKTNGAYLCDQKTSGNLSGQTLTFDSAVTNAVIEYELETETTEAYTSAQQTAYNKLKEMQSYYDLTYVAGTSDNIQPIITAHAKKSLKVMQNEIDSLESRLSVLE